jgi:hypothetical protein
MRNFKIYIDENLPRQLANGLNELQLVNRWVEIKQIIHHNRTPFAFRCTARTKFEKME